MCRLAAVILPQQLTVTALATVTSHHTIPRRSVPRWNPTRRSPAPLAVPPRGVTASAPEPVFRTGAYLPTVNDIDCQSDSASARSWHPTAGQRGSTSRIREAPTTHPAYSQPSLSTAHTCSVVASIGLDVEIIVPPQRCRGPPPRPPARGLGYHDRCSGPNGYRFEPDGPEPHHRCSGARSWATVPAPAGNAFSPPPRRCRGWRRSPGRPRTSCRWWPL